MNLGTFVVLLLVAGAVFFAMRSILKGSSRCSCSDCSSCGCAGSCSGCSAAQRMVEDMDEAAKSR